MGLPCPNIFAGGLNFHGKYEYLPVQSMEKASEVILNIIRNHKHPAGQAGHRISRYRHRHLHHGRERLP